MMLVDMVIVTTVPPHPRPPHLSSSHEGTSIEIGIRTRRRWYAPTRLQTVLLLTMVVLLGRKHHRGWIKPPKYSEDIGLTTGNYDVMAVDGRHVVMGWDSEEVVLWENEEEEEGWRRFISRSSGSRRTAITTTTIARYSCNLKNY